MNGATPSHHPLSAYRGKTHVGLVESAEAEPKGGR
jgi:hypothetical protein